ncbi:putative RNA-directed DNA polymerase from transposon X-element [Trichonephila clavipes]|nr:putative RNA-directed DNA polymerase from transposon X-element [Trichonephila clavipes]
MVNARFVYELEKNKCIPLFQSGFRKGRSTLDNIIQLESKIRNAFVRRNHLVSIFFDIEKAYDRTWRYGILRTLFNFGFRGNLPTFIKMFLNLRTFRASLYVDDLQISCEGSDMRMIERQLQTAVNNILKWCDTNGHSISASKSCCVHFCRKRGIHPDPEIRIRDIQIPVVPALGGSPLLDLVRATKSCGRPGMSGMKLCLMVFHFWWGLGGSGHVEGTGEKLSFASQAASSTGARDGLASMSLIALSAEHRHNPACLVVPGGAWMGSCIAERGALPRPLLVAESRADTLQTDSYRRFQICPKWKTEKEIQTIKTKIETYLLSSRRKLIAPQFSQTYALAKPSIATSTTQTDENITKVKCPPLQILKPLLSVPHPNASPFTVQFSNSTSSSPLRSITSKIDTQLTFHKPKSIPLQDTSDEDMLIYDVAEEVESPQKLTPVNEIEKFSDEWWQAEGWKREEYSRTLTPTRNRKSRIKSDFL